MKEKTSEELEEGPERAGKTISAVQLEYMTRRPEWGVSQMGKGEPSKGMQQRWEAQWQEFLKTLQSPYSAWGNLQLSETTPWDDAKAFLASFEQVAEACHWPREEWAPRLLPALSGEAEQAFRSLEARDQEDYGRVKVAILQGEALRREAQRQHFRQFCCPVVRDPRRIHSQVQELCLQWLKPERHSKEQILELLILEQFLASLPVELQGWIRAGGPDTCSQAVALAEDFLLSQQGTEGGKWQKPLQDVCGGSIDAEEVPSDIVQGQIYKEAKQLGEEEISLLDSGIKCPSHSSSSLTPEGRDMTRAGPSEGLLNLKETGVSLHVVERTLTQPGQQTMFWQVLPEEDGNMHSFGDGKGGQLKVENSQCGRNKPEDTSRTLPQISQGNVSVTAEMHEERCDEERYWIKMAKSQQGDTEPEEIHRVVVETIQWNFPVTSETHELRCESKGQPEKNPVDRGPECNEPAEGHTGAFGDSSAVSTEKQKPLYYNYGRKYHCKSDLVVTHTGENPFGYSMWGEEIQTKHCLHKPQGILTGEKQYALSECGESFHQRDGFIRQKNHPRDKPHEGPDVGKSFRHRQTLQRYQNIHSRRDLYVCSLCRKSFTSRAELTRHQRIHTGEKPYKCPECGKSFNRRENLMRHHRIHTGEKPYECSQCGKSYSRKEQLSCHQKIHNGE